MGGGGPVSPSRDPNTGSERPEFMTFLNFSSKLTDDVRDLNLKLADSHKKSGKCLDDNYSLGLENFGAKKNEVMSCPQGKKALIVLLITTLALQLKSLLWNI